MSPDVLVICVGNPSRGDDAAGPLVAEGLRASGAAETCTLVDTFQLQPELAEDMREASLVLIVDARVNTNLDILVSAVENDAAPGWCNHALSPEQLAGMYHSAYGAIPPEMITIGIRAEAFELGEAASCRVNAIAGQVVQGLTAWLHQLTPGLAGESALPGLQALFVNNVGKHCEHA